MTVTGTDALTNPNPNPTLTVFTRTPTPFLALTLILTLERAQEELRDAISSVVARLRVVGRWQGHGGTSTTGGESVGAQADC